MGAFVPIPVTPSISGTKAAGIPDASSYFTGDVDELAVLAADASTRDPNRNKILAATVQYVREKGGTWDLSTAPDWIKNLDSLSDKEFMYGVLGYAAKQLNNEEMQQKAGYKPDRLEDLLGEGGSKVQVGGDKKKVSPLIEGLSDEWQNTVIEATSRFKKNIDRDVRDKKNPGKQGTAISKEIDNILWNNSPAFAKANPDYDPKTGEGSASPGETPIAGAPATPSQGDILGGGGAGGGSVADAAAAAGEFVPSASGAPTTPDVKDIYGYGYGTGQTPGAPTPGQYPLGYQDVNFADLARTSLGATGGQAALDASGLGTASADMTAFGQGVSDQANALGQPIGAAATGASGIAGDLAGGYANTAAGQQTVGMTGDLFGAGKDLYGLSQTAQEGPSVAELLLKQGGQQAMNAQYSAAASDPSVSAALRQRNLASNLQNINQQQAQQAAVLRAQENQQFQQLQLQRAQAGMSGMGMGADANIRAGALDLGTKEAGLKGFATAGDLARSQGDLAMSGADIEGKARMGGYDAAAAGVGAQTNVDALQRNSEEDRLRSILNQDQFVQDQTQQERQFSSNVALDLAKMDQAKWATGQSLDLDRQKLLLAAQMAQAQGDQNTFNTIMGAISGGAATISALVAAIYGSPAAAKPTYDTTKGVVDTIGNQFAPDFQLQEPGDLEWKG